MSSLDESNPAATASDRVWGRECFVPDLFSKERPRHQRDDVSGKGFTYLLYHVHSKPEADQIRAQGLKSDGFEAQGLGVSRDVIDATMHDDDGFGFDKWAPAFHPGVYVDGEPCTEYDKVGSNTIVIKAPSELVWAFNGGLRYFEADLDTTRTVFLHHKMDTASLTHRVSECLVKGFTMDRFGRLTDQKTEGSSPLRYRPTAYVAASFIHPSHILREDEIPSKMKTSAFVNYWRERPRGGYPEASEICAAARSKLATSETEQPGQGEQLEHDETE